MRVLCRRLCSKLANNGAHLVYVLTARGIGYHMTKPSGFLLALFIPVEAAASGNLVVLGSTIELPAPAVAAPPAERCRERPRLLTPMLVGYAVLQAADAHSTLRAVAAGGVEANPSPVAQWACGPRREPTRSRQA